MRFASPSTCGLLASLFLSTTPVAAQQADPSYHIIQVPVRSFVETVLKEANARGVISDQIKSTLYARRISGPPEKILSAIADDAEIDVFQFNNTFYISDATEATTRLILLDNVGYDYALDALQKSSLILPQYPVIKAADGQALGVTGPPKYIALIEAVIKSLSKPAADKKRGPSVIVRRGTSAEVIFLNDPQSSVVTPVQADTPAAETKDP